MRWRIYYGDGSTFSDRDGSPFEAPRTNVQVIASEANTPTGFSLTHSHDAYVWRDEWNGTDQLGMWDYLMSHSGPQSVLFGRTVRDDVYWATIGRAGREGVS